eukprot:223429_1
MATSYSTCLHRMQADYHFRIRHMDTASRGGLLLVALDARSTVEAGTVVVVVLGLVVLASELFHVNVAFVHRGFIEVSPGGEQGCGRHLPKDLPECLDLAGCDGLWEDDVDDDDEITLFASTGPLHRHAFPMDRVDPLGLHDLPSHALDEDLPAVQVADHQFEATDGIHQAHVLFDDQGLALALEKRVGLLLEKDEHVTRKSNAWDLIALPCEGDEVSGLHALLDVHLKYLAIFYELLPHAIAALVLLSDVG